MSTTSRQAYVIGGAIGFMLGVCVATGWFLLSAPLETGGVPAAAPAETAAVVEGAVPGAAGREAARRPARGDTAGADDTAKESGSAPTAGSTETAAALQREENLPDQGSPPADDVSTGEGSSAEVEPVESASPPEAPPIPNPELSERDRVRQHERLLESQLSNDLVVHVIDAVTELPLDGIDVSVFVGTFQSGGISSGSRTDAEGNVKFSPKGWVGEMHGFQRQWGGGAQPIGSLEDPLLAVVRIRAPGYQPFGEQATGKHLVARLEPNTVPKGLGGLQGYLRAADGQPWIHPIVLSLQDPTIIDQVEVTVIPDSNGWFELSGLTAGTWGVKIDTGWGDRTQVEIPAGGSAYVELQLSEDQTHGPPEFPADLRPVTVTAAGDFPFGAVILLEGEWEAPLRIQLQAGVASFHSVPLGAVRIRLRRPDAPDQTQPAIVAAGEGAFEIPFEVRQ